MIEQTVQTAAYVRLNVCLSHLENKTLDFDVNQTGLGGGVISSFTDVAPPLHTHFEPLFLLACGTSPCCYHSCAKHHAAFVCIQPPMHTTTACTPFNELLDIRLPLVDLYNHFNFGLMSYT